MEALMMRMLVIIYSSIDIWWLECKLCKIERDRTDAIMSDYFYFSLNCSWGMQALPSEHINWKINVWETVLYLASRLAVWLQISRCHPKFVKVPSQVLNQSSQTVFPFFSFYKKTNCFKKLCVVECMTEK